MLFKVGKVMMAAALTLAVVPTVFVVLFFRDEPEPLAAAEPVAETIAEAAGSEDPSQPWLDLPAPKAQPAPEPTPEPEPVTVEPEPEPAPVPVEESEEPVSDRSEVKAAKETRRSRLAPGAILGVTVPEIGVYNAPVFDSTRPLALKSGVGHVPETSLPWTDAPQRNVFLAGHRLGFAGTGSWRVFHDLGDLGRGDEVILKDRRGRAYRYRVTETFIADPNDSWVMGQVRGRDMVTLQTCTPIPTFEKRIIVRADRI